MKSSFCVGAVLALFWLSGCGSDASTPTGGNPTTTEFVASTDDLFDSEPELAGGAPGATPSQAQSTFRLTLSGSSNAQMAPLVQGATTKTQAVLTPTAAAPTSFQARIQNEPATRGLTRFMDIRYGEGNSKILQIGEIFQANSNSTGPRVQVVYGEIDRQAPPRVFLFQSTSGAVRLTQLVPGTARSGSVTLRFEGVVMNPRPGQNTATGSFALDGEATLTF